MEYSKDQIIDAVGNMSVMELIALTRQLEEKWGVKAEPPPVKNSVPHPVEEIAKTEFNVVLASVPADKKMAVIKVVRDLTLLGLKESKELVEAAPKIIKESLSTEEAQSIKTKLEEAGAVVEVK